MRLIDADVIDFNKVFGGRYAFAEDARNAAQSLIDIQPTVEAEPVRHGRWTEKKINGGGIWDYYFVCSECHHETPNRGYTIAPDYCPGCGAKMDGDEFNE